jgi:hypothetical protein
MRQSWDDIVAKYRELRETWTGPAQEAAAGIEHVATLIADGPLRSILFGWTSMHDLCIQQTDVPPNSGPHLRIIPENSMLSTRYSGMVELRYVDTMARDRQWARVVSPGHAPGIFVRFLTHLRWAPELIESVKEHAGLKGTPFLRGKRLTDDERTALKALRQLLRNEWNPIDIDELPDDEYDDYASVLFGLLVRGAAIGEALRYLSFISEDWMRSPVEDRRNLIVAEKARAIVDRLLRS